LIIFKFYYFILPVDGTNVLSPVAPPRITPFGMPLRNVMVNSRVQVSCVIEEGDAPFHIRWFRDDKPLLHHVPSIETPIRSNGLRLTDFNSYSSILTIDQVVIIFV
jgi:hypothetical protein